ncbi:MAG: creatininase family protein [Gammaproteobacteria bacterium]|nr:creatininase family protein [Gammaproteobacteria bacterium]MDH3534145.1 creatininase family protein [Gammaproteobacteria bacterium]
MERGVKLETLTWIEAEQWFAHNPVVVIPLGAAAKEHGPHLPLNNDALIAGWLADEIMQRLPVVIAPLINASFYPAFVEYPGSISLRVETARDVIVDTCNSLVEFGLSRFYVINTGLSTLRPLAEAAKRLDRGIRFEYLNIDDALQVLPPGLIQQRYGSHADETETSLMLHIAPQVVDMSRAVDDGAEGEGRLTRSRGEGIWSGSGVFGQATLASADKGGVIAEMLMNHTLAQIERLMP